MKFQKKPEIIEAIRWDGTEEAEAAIQEITGPGVYADRRKASPPIVVPTQTGVVRGPQGGWVVKYPLGGIGYLTHEAMLLSYQPVGLSAIQTEPQESLEDAISRIVDAKLAAQADMIPDLDIPADSFSQQEGGE